MLKLLDRGWRRLPLPFRVLHRQFLLRVVELEALSIEADIPRFVGQFAGILIMISLVKCLGTLLFGIPPQLVLVVEHGQIENMLLVIGVVVVLTWDATFPDRRDVMVLGPLPVSPRTILAAKIAATATLLGIAILALNFASSLPYALVLGVHGFFRFFFAYWFTMAAGAVLLYGSVLMLQGFAALVLPRRAFLQLSGILQLGAYVTNLVAYFLPGVVTWNEVTAPQNHWMVWSPSIWLLALLNQLNGSLPHEAAWLAGRAWIAMGTAAAGASGALALCYLRTMKRTVEQPDLVPGAGGFHWLSRFGSSLRSAIVLFSLRSITRSRQHRIVLAFYWSVVFAIGLALVRHQMATAPEAISMDFLMSTYLMMCFAILGLRGVFSLPISLKANWVLRLTQLQPTGKYIAATRDCMLLLGAAPIWIICSALSLHFRPWQQVAEHLVFLALLACVLAELSLIRFEKVPFTCSVLPGNTNIQVIFWGFGFVAFILAFLLASYEHQALGSSRRLAIMAVSAAAAILGLRFANTNRAKSAQLYFEETEPEILTRLGLIFVPEGGTAPQKSTPV